MAARLARRWRRSCGGIAAAAARETCPTDSGSNANGTVAQKYLLTESDPPPILCSLVSEYEQQLRQIHRNVHPHTEWASLSAKKRRTEGAEDETERLLSDATPLIAATRALPKGRIDVTAVMDANIHDPYRSKLASMEYSAGGELFMTASRNGRVSLFHMDGEENPLVDAMGIKNFTIIRAGFLPQKDKVPQSVHFSPSPQSCCMCRFWSSAVLSFSPFSYWISRRKKRRGSFPKTPASSSTASQQLPLKTHQ